MDSFYHKGSVSTKAGQAHSAFLAALFDGCEGLIEVRAIPVSKEDGRSIHRAFFSRDAISDVLDWCRPRLGGDGDGLYVAVATRQSDASGALENCQALPALFVDCDFKDSSEGAVRARLEVFSLQPSIVVHSGHGLHAYWLLKEPIDLVEDAAEAGQLLRRLAAHLQGVTRPRLSRHGSCAFQAPTTARTRRPSGSSPGASIPIGDIPRSISTRLSPR